MAVDFGGNIDTCTDRRTPVQSSGGKDGCSDRSCGRQAARRSRRGHQYVEVVFSTSYPSMYQPPTRIPLIPQLSNYRSVSIVEPLDLDKMNIKERGWGGYTSLEYLDQSKFL